MHLSWQWNGIPTATCSSDDEEDILACFREVAAFAAHDRPPDALEQIRVESFTGPEKIENQPIFVFEIVPDIPHGHACGIDDPEGDWQGFEPDENTRMLIEEIQILKRTMENQKHVDARLLFFIGLWTFSKSFFFC